MTKVNKLTWNFITESNNWSIYQDGYEICKRFNNYNIKTFISKRVKIKKNNIVHYGSINMFKTCILQKFKIVSKISKFLLNNFI